jgi:hypothetical protein
MMGWNCGGASAGLISDAEQLPNCRTAELPNCRTAELFFGELICTPVILSEAKDPRDSSFAILTAGSPAEKPVNISAGRKTAGILRLWSPRRPPAQNDRCEGVLNSAVRQCVVTHFTIHLRIG